MNTKILLVEDSKSDMMILESILSDYHLCYAFDGAEAMEILQGQNDFDIMILDLSMPKMNGFEILAAIGKDKKKFNITTIILTNSEEVENEIRGLDMGAVDYIRKPVNYQSLRKRVEIHIRLREASKFLEKHNAILEETVQERTRELAITRNITIHALVKLLEVRNIESSNHALRTQKYMLELCRHLSKKDKYRNILTDEYIKELYNTAPLHDIGKVGIPDSILLKPGKLTPKEFEYMKKHTTFGVKALRCDTDNTDSYTFLKTASQIIGEHHERYDGKGYPRGLKGEEISLPGRLMAIIDVFDALISERVYKPAIEYETALQIIAQGKGTQFDADLVDGFLEIKDIMTQIKDSY